MVSIDRWKCQCFFKTILTGSKRLNASALCCCSSAGHISDIEDVDADDDDLTSMCIGFAVCVVLLDVDDEN
jgi:hypothetical protein